MRQVLLIAMLAVVCAGVVHADVTTEDKTQVKFAGMLGRMMNLFGGRATRDGVVSAVAVKGDRMARRTDQTEQIVDLKEEEVYNVNLKDKSYTVTTFADMRRQMEEARKKAADQVSKQQPDASAAGGQQPNVEVDFNLKESGASKAINGFDAREVVMTIAVREKGKTLEQGGGLLMTTSHWLAPRIESMKEVLDFEKRFAEKLALPTMIDAQQMASVMAMYPMMGDAMKRFQAESVNLNGTPVMTLMTVRAVGATTPEAGQAKQEPKQEAAPRGLGGLAGRLGRRVIQKDPEPAGAGPVESDSSATFMTMQHELLKVTPTAADADLQIPAGFKQR